jgi:hypothetical protein
MESPFFVIYGGYEPPGISLRVQFVRNYLKNPWKLWKKRTLFGFKTGKIKYQKTKFEHPGHSFLSLVICKYVIFRFGVRI